MTMAISCCAGASELSPVFWYGTATGSDHPTRMAVIALAVAALLFGLGMFLYRKRPSEAAGRAMAFKVK